MALKRQKKPKVLMVGTGGTLSAKIVNGAWKPGELNNEEILKLTPELSQFVTLKSTNLLRIDSSNMQPEMWLTLAQIIYYDLPNVDGVVVTHGTDTMQYSASALSFLIQNLNVPIVFTGSQVAPQEIGSDARKNLMDGVRVAVEGNIAESVIVFNGKIFRGNRAKKLRELDFDAFMCVGMPPLGKVEQNVMLTGEQFKRGNRKPVLMNKLETDVALLKIYPGFKPGIIDHMINEGIKGFVIEGYGAGNIPTEKRGLTGSIKNATNSGIPVVITTQCSLGSSWVYLYDVGVKAIEAGAMPGYDTLSETALVKLMWILGQTRELKKVKKMMLTNYAGEITPGMRKIDHKTLWEVTQ